VHFEIGDASTAQLPASDVVLLNRVVCCYPDASELVANTLAAAGKVFAFTAPVDHGAIGAANRLFMWWSNRWYAMRERKYKGFRVFMHDLNRIHDSVQSAGFIRVQRERRRLVWDLAVYQRERSPA
jgi:magnesium-protoporphyrin O-methyltransferase